ncbi:unnamed protein product [Chironomus riparius]|uniref:Uncharacterized protein n=1 Tax=Chironomus riparius TaxID=315576 RepID=A0A9N9WYF5_9DIPT|nr:unnamed protein product [Chironomus riparius]
MYLFSVIRQKSSVLKRMWKFLGYSLLVLALGIQTIRLFKKLKLEPELFSKESSIQSSQIPFPGVTVCPPFVIDKKALEPDFLRLNNLTEYHLKSVLVQTCPDIMKYDQNGGINVDLVDVLQKVSQNITESMMRCGINDFHQDFDDCERFFHNSLTDDGLCFTFNMLGYHSMFKDGLSSDFDIFKRTRVTKTWEPNISMNHEHHDDVNDPEPTRWTLETGYLSNDSLIQPARAVKMQTLEIVTNLVKNQKLCANWEQSYRVVLHLPNELPQLTYQMISVPLGKEKRILVSARMVKFEKSLRKFPANKRGCYYEDEKPLKIFKSYTKVNCEYECMISFIYSTCGCVKFSMPRTKDMKVCGFMESKCSGFIAARWPRSYYRNETNKRKFPEYPCGCIPSCTEIKYRVVKEVETNTVFSHLQFHSNIKVIFVNSQIEKISNYVTYRLENFILDVGGLIGICLGSSLLSLPQYLLNACYNIVTYIKKAFRMCKMRNKKNEQVHPQSRLDAVVEIQFDEVTSIDGSESNQQQTIFSISNGQTSLLEPVHGLREEIWIEEM